MKNKVTMSAAIIVGCGVLFSFSSVNALDNKTQLKLGKMEYLNSCASCHGSDAKGGGPVATAFKIKPSDLTMITKDFSGIFPDEHIYNVIDGRNIINPHGDTDMPVWGDRYATKARNAAEKIAHPLLREQDTEALVFGRITSLVGYLESIQAK